MKILVQHYEGGTGPEHYAFQLQLEDIVLQSEDFSDRTNCIEFAYEILTLLKNKQSAEGAVYLFKEAGKWLLNVAGQHRLQLLQPTSCEDAEEAHAIVEELLNAAKGEIVLTEVQLEETAEDEPAEPEVNLEIEAEVEEEQAESDPEERDDYHLELASRAEDLNFVTYTEPVDGEERFFFQFNDKAGNPLLFSEAYQTESGRKNGMESVRRNAVKKAQYVAKEEKGKYFFVLKAGNHQEISRSRDFDSRKEMERLIFWLQIRFKSSNSPVVSARSVPGTGLVVPPLPIPALPQEITSSEILTPCGPTFKPLEPLDLDDFPLFWGRTQELDDLYGMTFDTNLLLLYGAAGSGKSSMVHCGLPNRFSTVKWYGITVTRGADINQSLQHQLEREWQKIDHKQVAASEAAAAAYDPQVEGIQVGLSDVKAVLSEQEQVIPEGTSSVNSDLLEKLHQIYQSNFKPIYLIFDDLEDLFQEEVDPKEQAAFFSFLQALAKSQGKVKAILVINETYLAHLTSYEKIVPNLLENRYRLNPMSGSEIAAGLCSSLGTLDQHGALQTPNPETTASSIVDRMGGRDKKIGLPCIQIYLHQLHKKACKQKSNGSLPVFDEKLVEESGRPRKLIKSYFKEQLAALDKQKSQADPDLDRIREKEADLRAAQGRCIPTPNVFPFWSYWMLGGPLVLFFFMWVLWAPAPALNCLTCIHTLKSNDPDAAMVKKCRELLKEEECRECQVVIELGSCENMNTYLMTYGENGDCADTIRLMVAERCKECDLDMDSLSRTLGEGSLDLCALYQNYLAIHGDDGYCSSEVRSYLERHCIIDPSEDCDKVNELLVSHGGNRDLLGETHRRMLDNCECDATRIRASNNCDAYEVYLENYGDNGICSSEFRRKLKECRDCDVARSKNTCKAYEAYIARYGSNGRCYEEFQLKMKEGGCSVPIGDICYLKASPYPVTWRDSHNACAEFEGFEPICESQVRFLLRNYYQNNLATAYPNMIAPIIKYTLNFDPQGFWTATEFSDAEGYSIFIDKKGEKRTLLLQGVNKDQERPCLCIKKGTEFKNSGLKDMICDKKIIQ